MKMLKIKIIEYQFPSEDEYSDMKVIQWDGYFYLNPDEISHMRYDGGHTYIRTKSGANFKADEFHFVEINDKSDISFSPPLPSK
jgi:hypothetical protein